MEEEVAKIDEKIADARKNYGDIEVRDAILEKAKWYRLHKDYEVAKKTYLEAYDITMGSSKRMDILFDILLMAIETQNLDLIRDNIEKCKKLLEEGGDWEHRNRLKVFDGIYNILIRDFKNAASLLIDCVATFTSTDIFSFKELVFYAVLTSMVGLDRTIIRQKVVHSPEILSEIRETPFLKQFLDSLYLCDYKSFFEAFGIFSSPTLFIVEIIETVKKDRFMSKHSKYFVKEMRIVAYSQFLESYKSVTLESMAKAFGVSTAFLDKELSTFIAAGRISCKIDKVAGIIESNRPDERIALYQKIIKEGDFLLNRIQKLSRAMDL